MNIQLSGYRKYYKVPICRRTCNYNEGMIKNRIFWDGQLGLGEVGPWILLEGFTHQPPKPTSRPSQNSTLILIYQLLT
jgi:hypothetical protein